MNGWRRKFPGDFPNFRTNGGNQGGQRISGVHGLLQNAPDTRMLTSGDITGFIILVMTYFVPLLFRTVRMRRSTVLAVWTVVSAHHVVAIWLAFVGQIRGITERDPSSFHLYATEWQKAGSVELAIGAEAYIQFLGVVYRIFGSSWLVGNELSVLAFTFATCVLVALCHLVDHRQNMWLIVLLFGCWPTVLLNTAITIREAYESLFLLVSVYYAVQFHFTGKGKYLLLCTVSTALFGFTHKGMLIYSVLLLPMLAYWPLTVSSQRRYRRNRSVHLSVLLLCLLLATSALPVVVSKSSDISGMFLVARLSQGDVTQVVSEYQNDLGGAGGRSDYGPLLDSSNPVVFLATAVQSMVYFWVTPFPWWVRTAKDLFGSMEGMLRLLLIACALITLYRGNTRVRRTQSLLVAIFVSISFVWALGTANYGTAMRHNIPGYGILLVAALPAFSSFLARLDVLKPRGLRYR